MLQTFRRFIRGLSTDWVGRVGVVLTTSSFVMFLIMELLQDVGLITAAYVGLISYMALPAMFMVGLALVPVGWWRLKKRTGYSTRELLSERFGAEMLKGGAMGSQLFTTILALTTLNIVFLGAGSARMLSFMEEPEFCGTACHSVMGPEWATFQHSPHAHVRCVDCHVGEGAEALLESKINGAWQVISLTFDLYERPIPTPVHNLRPARETCEKCHWPQKFYGDRIKTSVNYGMDEANTAGYTSLALKVGGADGRRGSIHWHVSKDNEVRYASTDEGREAMAWVEVLQPNGAWRRYTNQDVTEGTEPRAMDCVDCHNRATHVFEDPEEAIDEAMTAGRIDSTIPSIKRAAFAALTGSYPGDERALIALKRGLHRFYQDEYPEQYSALSPRLDKVVAELQTIYSRNIHPNMNVRWNGRPDHLGHKRGGGCFRCHNDDMLDESGESISQSCSLCHSILSWNSPKPFSFLQPLQADDPDLEMKRSLQSDFLGELPTLPEEAADGTFDRCKDGYEPCDTLDAQPTAKPDPYAPAEPDDLPEREHAESPKRQLRAQ